MKIVGFCGISGSGMSALAQVLKAKGFEVRGSDRSFDNAKDTANKQALESVDIKIFPQDGSMVTDDLDCLYVSTAVEDSISDVKRALEKHITIKKRSDLLAEIFNNYRYGIAVGGTSGKTTVTAMIGYILDKLDKKPTVINGGLLKNYLNHKGIANVILNDGDICVVEADESDGSIEKYTPFVAVVNNIGLDHKELDELKRLFADFAKKAKGGAVVNLDCENSKELLQANSKVVTFSVKNPDADVYISDIKPLLSGLQYKLKGDTFTLPLIGEFNAANAAAAIAGCVLLGIKPTDAAKVLEGFLGTKRRLDVIGITNNNITVIDDFAHNPDKVYASTKALRDYKGRLLIMFQPHGFSPMRMMGKAIVDSFAKTLSADDRLFMPEIFYAGGTVKKDISSQDLINYALSKGIKAEFYQTRDEIKERLGKIAQPGDRIVVMGARDNTLPVFCQEIINHINEGNGNEYTK